MKFQGPKFSPLVTMKLDEIWKAMPRQFLIFEMRLWIHELTGEWHHPAVFFLANYMMNWSDMLKSERFRLAPSYPLTEDDQRVLRQIYQAKKDGSSQSDVGLFDIGCRAYKRLEGDVLELMRRACARFDSVFFSEWSKASRAVAVHDDDGRIVSQEVKIDGNFVEQGPLVIGEAKLVEGQSFLMEVINARMAYFVNRTRKGHKGQWPTDPEVARLIWEKRKQDKGGIAPLVNVARLRGDVYKCRRRNGLPGRLSAKTRK